MRMYGQSDDSVKVAIGDRFLAPNSRTLSGWRRNPKRVRAVKASWFFQVRSPVGDKSKGTQCIIFDDFRQDDPFGVGGDQVLRAEEPRAGGKGVPAKNVSGFHNVESAALGVDIHHVEFRIGARVR